MEEREKNIVEILESGEVKFAGRLISSAEFLVGTALCGLKNNIRDTNLEEEFNDVKANESLGSELSDDNSSHSIPVVSASKVKAAKLHPAKKKKN